MNVEKLIVINENYIEDLLNKSLNFKFNDSSKSLKYAEEAYNYSLEINFKRGQALANYYIASCYWTLGELDTSINYSLKALDFQKEYYDRVIEVKVLNNLGNVFIDMKNYEKGLNYYLKALRGAKEIDDKRSVTVSLNNIGEIYKELKEYKIALDYYKESQEIATLLNEINILATLCLNEGEINYFLGEYETAINSINKSIELGKQIKNIHTMAESYHYLGLCYLKSNKIQEAYDNFILGILRAERSKNKLYEIDIILDLVNLHNIKGLIEKREKWLLKAKDICEELNAFKKLVIVSSKLILLYEEKDDLKELQKYYKVYLEASNKVNEENDKQNLHSVKILIKVEESLRENEEIRKKHEELLKRAESLNEAYRNIKTISEIGRDITGTMNIDKILMKVYQNINKLVDAYNFGIAIYDARINEIYYDLFIENGERVLTEPININNENSIAAYSIRNKEVVFINNLKEESIKYIKSFERMETFGKELEIKSVIYCPLILENRVMGVITVQSKNENSYNDLSLEAVNALGSYISIALNNANKSDALIKLNKKFEILSNIDVLTGIANRRKLNSILEKEWNRCRRRRDEISLIILDIDFFKEYNDNYGHIRGDEAIKKVAKSLNKKVERSSDLLARFGGDEFIILLPESDSNKAKDFAELIRSTVESCKIPHLFSKVYPYITVTIGVATLIPGELNNENNLMQFADRALYLAKQRGRNQVATFKDI